MEIIKYAGKHCVKCKVLDRIFPLVELPCEVQVKYVEDEGEDKFQALGITNLPTLSISNNGEEVKLSGAITPQMIKEAIEKVS